MFLQQTSLLYASSQKTPASGVVSSEVKWLALFCNSNDKAVDKRHRYFGSPLLF